MPVARSVAAADGASLATEAFGAPEAPALVLIMGATASMLDWPDTFCAALAAQGRFVLRFDHRDTGASTTLPPGMAGYSIEDMAGDVLAVLDGWDIGCADVLGMSLGGYIAQILALTAPDRVRSLTLFASEPLGWDGPDLPGISAGFLEHFGQIARLDWSDRAAVVELLLRGARLCAVDQSHLDETAERRRIERVLSRTDSPQSAFNHASLVTEADWSGRLREIRCPVLVLHGGRDPILPPEHGRALAASIPGARLIELPGLGHALPAAFIPEIVRHIGDHLAAVDAAPATLD